MIKSIEFIADYHPFTTGDKFEFNNVNILVGDQGTGKSTLLHLIMNFGNPDFDKIYKMEFTSDSTGEMIFLDTEKHNPRAIEVADRSDFFFLYKFAGFVSEKQLLSPNSESEFLESIEEYRRYATDMSEDITIMSRFKSHGQVLLPMLKEAVANDNGIIFIDEPETSLSIRSQRVIASHLKNTKSQVFVATHSPIIMDVAVNVLSLEHKSIMTPTDFINTQI